MSETQSIAHFRRLLVQESESSGAWSDDLLLCFLRARKSDVGRALKLLKNFLRMRHKHPHLLTNLSWSSLERPLSLGLQGVCGRRDPDGRRVFVFRAGQWDPSACSLEDIFRCNVLYLQRLASEEETQRNGVVAVVDLKGFSLHQARHFSPRHAGHIAELIKDCFPIRFQAIHLIHEPWIFGMVLTVIWPLLSAKMQQRIFSHGQSLDSLLARVDAKCLPESCGGLHDSAEAQRWIRGAGCNLFECFN